jgi:predicted RND superfamily exporter protein
MGLLAQLLVRRSVAFAVVVGVLLVSAIGGYYALRVGNEDDILAFLPRGNREVKTFYDINSRFGGLDVGLVGIEAEEVFDAEFLTRLAKVSRELKDMGGLSAVLSLTTVNDFTADEQSGGIVAAPLVPAVPGTPAAMAELRAKVLSREHVVGNLISENGKAVLVYCFLSYGVDPRATSDRIRAIVTAGFPRNKVNWGGNPFISSYVYETVQGDLRRLTPWAIGVIVLLMVVALRDLVGTFLALLSNGLAIGVTIGLMSLLKVKLNLMLGSMPIVLFAIGCTYAIHILFRYFDHRSQQDTATSIERTLTGLGPALLAAGFTSAAAIASYVVMDIQPIRHFGIFTAVGILVTMVFALTFVPAALVLIDLGRKPSPGPGIARRLMARLATFCEGHRWPVGLGVGLLTALGVLFVTRIHTGVDQRSFFADGSPPDRADQFLREHFGAAQFVQVLVKGDMNDPDVLHVVQSLSDRIEQVPHVTSVQNVAGIVSILNQAMTGERRLPDTSDQVRNLTLFAAGDTSIGQVVTADHDQALLQIKVDTARAEDMPGVLEPIQQLIDEERLGALELVRADGPRGAEVRQRLQAELGWRLQNLARKAKVALPGDWSARLGALLAKEALAVDSAPIATALQRFLRSAECAVELPAPKDGVDPAAELASAIAALGSKPAEAAVRDAAKKALGDAANDELVTDLASAVGTPLREIWRGEQGRQRTAQLFAALGVSVPPGQAGDQLRANLTMAVLDLGRATALLPAASGAGGRSLDVQVNGLPVLHRGLARSVERNQLQSMGLAVVLVVVILSFVFRSIRTGLMAACPTLFTLVAIHGAMGLLGINLDIGTSLLGSLILANGVDYAVHLITSWRAGAGKPLREAASHAALHSGPAIWTSAGTMFIGFFVLAMGDAKPLQNVTGLKAAAMLVGAIATFLIVPVLARRRSYRLRGEGSHEAPAAAASPAPVPSPAVD